MSTYGSRLAEKAHEPGKAMRWLWLSLLLMLAASIWRRDMSTQTTFCLRMQAANGGVRPDVSVGNRGKGWNS